MRIHKAFFFLCTFSIRHEFCNLVHTSSVVFFYAMYHRICSFYVIMLGKELKD